MTAETEIARINKITDPTAWYREMCRFIDDLTSDEEQQIRSMGLLDRYNQMASWLFACGDTGMVIDWEEGREIILPEIPPDPEESDNDGQP